MWNKLYKRSLFDGLKFSNYVSEDTLMNGQIFLRIDKLVYINKALYFYYQRSDSIVHSKYNIKKLSEIDSRRSMYEIIKKACPQLTEYFYARYMQTIIQHALCLVENSQYAVEYKKLEEILLQNKIAILENDHIEKRFKHHCIRLISDKIKDKIFYKIRRFIKRQ